MRTTCFSLVLLLFSISGQDPSVGAQQTPGASSGPIVLSLAGLKDRVTVLRDDRGVPYIEAKNNDDLYFAQGYVTASDRLWQMDLLRRSGRGELAEIFGASVLETDKAHRRYGFARISEEEVAHSSPEARATLESYSRGVNAFIASLDDASLPGEFKKLGYKPKVWSPADSLVMLKNFAEGLSNTWQLDLMRAALSGLPEQKRRDLFADKSSMDVLVVGTDGGNGNRSALAMNSIPPTESGADLEMLEQISSVREMTAQSLERIGLYAEDLAASNNWVVSGRHTVTGKPLLANDPHLDASAPSIWYLVNLSAPGVRVAGVSSPGIPGVVIGHNEYIAWGMTNLGPDVQDLYLEKFDTSKPGFYQTPSGLREAQIIHEPIKVRKNFVGTETDVIPFDVTITRHGPIVFEKDNSRYALHWTALDLRPVENDSLFGVNRAHNWTEFQAALSNYPGPTQNFVYADVNGHIGFYDAGIIPIRKTGDGSVPYDGSTDDGEWTGYIPFARLPHVYDPPSGMIATANQRIAGDSYPYFLSHVWAMPYRAHRIMDRLSVKSRLSVDDFRAIEGDTYVYPAHLFAKQFVAVFGKTPENERPETFKTFEKWDGFASMDSRAALWAILMRDAFRRRIVNAAIGADAAKNYRWPETNIFIDRVLTEMRPEWLPTEFKNYAELLAACEKDARETITKKLGGDVANWTWGQFDSFRFPHPLAPIPFIGQPFVIAPIPQAGSGSSVNVGNSVSMRFIADPSNWDNTRHGITLGESGNPENPHWKDQLDRWLKVDPAIFPFSEAAVSKAATPSLVLQPK